ncbi:Hypothetical predicted protein [Mytilus galloprovincialis]|uniref:CCHC-type domain-containing protein n=1 Tax=Mytilus galloprovincialis TaxID=29158 RepID=A0A8B6EVS3_MYTGA|nr:Hypothetical predicted protein [Mytilus galloprovincialis]
MDYYGYSLRPAWMWNYMPYRVNPERREFIRMCGKCGRQHTNKSLCAARNSKCFKCQKPGHFARQCFTRVDRVKIHKNELKTVSISTQTENCNNKKSIKKKERDSKRLQDYFDRKRTLQELPFNKTGNTVFISTINSDCFLRDQIETLKTQLGDESFNHTSTLMELQEEQENVRKLRKTIKNRDAKIIELENTVQRYEKGHDKITDYITEIKVEKENWKLQCSDVSEMYNAVRKSELDLKATCKNYEHELEQLKNHTRTNSGNYHQNRRNYQYRGRRY